MLNNRVLELADKVLKTLVASPAVYVTGGEVLIESVRDLIGLRPGHSDNNEEHLAHLVQWLCTAQDASPDEGVARSYSLTYIPFFKRRGWFGSYPETTGYIIPTMFDYFHFSRDEEFQRRAIAMAAWEQRIQMDSGAVMGGTVDFPPTPAVFNTGQVIFGWCRTYMEIGDERFLDAARRAGDFLVQAQDADGSWRNGSSKFAAQETTVYNTRCSWALALLDSLVQKGKYRDAAVKNIEWALTKQGQNGWFDANCLDDASQPLVHTIAYAVQGILETAVIVEDDRFLDAAANTARLMAGLLRDDGSLAGRYDVDWNSTVSWSCLTGNMQMSIVWQRMYQLGIGDEMRVAAARINRFNRSLHNLKTRSPGRKGGVKGAYPIYGDYGRFEYLNWAVKFTIDALLLEEKLNGNKRIADAESRGAPLFRGS